ncbi:MAG: ATP-binding protein [Opitutales bacterium]
MKQPVPPSPVSHWPRIWVFIGLLLVYVATGQLGLMLAFSESEITLVWAPMGIVVAAMFVFGFWIWPVVPLAQVILQLFQPGMDLSVIPAILANTIGPVVTVLLLRWASFDRRLRAVRDVLGLVFIAGLPGALVTALIGVGLDGVLDPNPEDSLGRYSTHFVVWALGDLLSLLIFTPLLLLGLRQVGGDTSAVDEGGPSAGEATGLLALFLGVGWVAFQTPDVLPLTGYPLAFLAFPFLVWAAFRFGMPGAVLTNFAVAVLAVVGMVRGVGPFALNGEVASIIVLGLYLTVTSATALFLAVANEARREAEDRVEHQREFFRLLFDHLPSGVMVLDRRKRVLFVNQFWADLFGRTVEDFESGDILPEAALYRPEADMSLLSDSHQVIAWKRQLETEDATTRHIEFLKRSIPVDARGERGILIQALDQTEYSVAQDELRDSQTRLKAALEGAEIGLWDWDVAKDKVHRDDSWYRLLGFRRDQFEVEDPFMELLHPEDVEATVAEHRKQTEARASFFETEYRLMASDGAYRWFSSRGFVTDRDEADRPLRVVGSIYDITERKAFEIGLSEAKNAAETANNAKSYFLANMSHEIRTPLNAVLGMASVLRETPLNEEQQDCLQTIVASSQSLFALINDVLDFSKVESGRFELDVQEFPLKLCCEEAVALFRPRVNEKGLNMELTIDAEADGYIFGDINRLRQVLINLLGNAVKFTEEGEILFDVRKTSLDALPEVYRGEVEENSRVYLPEGDAEYLLLTVNDTGIGISEDRQDKLFESFTQADPTTTRKFGGTGLGLAICRKLVQSMGGAIWLESAPGVGTTFNVVIKAVYAHDEPEGEGAAQDGESGSFPRLAEQFPYRILVAEDNQENRQAITAMLRRYGYNATSVATGREVLRALENRFYDLIFMDVEMPEMDGLETTRHIRKHKSRDEQPVIVAVTAHAFKGDRERCLLSGMNEFVPKPVRPSALEMVIRTTAQFRKQ